MTAQRSDRPHPRNLPPGHERRSVLLQAGEPVTLADFDDQELKELLADLHQIKAQIRNPRQD